MLSGLTNDFDPGLLSRRWLLLVSLLSLSTVLLWWNYNRPG